MLMKSIKQISFLFFLGVLFYACGSSFLQKESSEVKEEAVVIANDSLEYEIIIIDIGFTNYLNGIAKPRNFYSQEYLEARNKAWVTIWNQRALNINTYNPNIYENTINYEQTIDYGYEVNYLLFNYFVFAQQKYNMSLGGGFRRGRIN